MEKKINSINEEQSQLPPDVKKHFAIGGKIILPGLRISVQLPENVGFKTVEGYPFSEIYARETGILNGHIPLPNAEKEDRLLQRILTDITLYLGEKRIKRQIPDINANDLSFLSSQKNGNTVYLQSIKPNLPPHFEVFAKGYGSGLLIEQLNQREVLQTYLQNIGLNSGALTDHQEKNFASTCGIAAIYDHHINNLVYKLEGDFNAFLRSYKAFMNERNPFPYLPTNWAEDPSILNEISRRFRAHLRLI